MDHFRLSPCAILFGMILGLGDARVAHAQDAPTQKAYEEAMAEGAAAAERKDWDESLEAYRRALELKDGDAGAEAGIEKVEAGRGTLELVLDEKKNIRMVFVRIKAGSFCMGSEDAESDERPIREVTISRGFWMGKTEVTQGEWKALMGVNPSTYKGDQLPVENVSWEQSREFIKKLDAGQLRGRTAALPTEAEWEYACRAGTTSKWSFGEEESKMGDFGWFKENSGRKTHGVGEKMANPWNLNDMHGNVMEWCEDWYGEYTAGKVTDPRGAVAGSERVVRGGNVVLGARSCRSAFRNRFPPEFRHYMGFRVVLR